MAASRRHVNVGDQVITLHGRPREVLAVHDQGLRPVLKITTASGRVVRAHPDHLFLTPNSWVAAKDLLPKMVLALPRQFEIRGSSPYTRDHFALAGYMMARAIVTGRTYSRLHRITQVFRCDDPAILADFKAICARLGIRHQTAPPAKFRAGSRARRTRRPAVICSKNSASSASTRTRCACRLGCSQGSEDEIGALLGAIISCDGLCVPKVNAQTGKQRSIRLTIKRNAARRGCRQTAAAPRRQGQDPHLVSAATITPIPNSSRSKSRTPMTRRCSPSACA
jgi:hypothetical protein